MLNSKKSVKSTSAFFFFFVTICCFCQDFPTFVHFQVVMQFRHHGLNMKTSMSKSLSPLRNGAFTQTTKEELLIMEVDFSEGAHISGLL